MRSSHFLAKSLSRQRQAGIPLVLFLGLGTFLFAQTRSEETPLDHLKSSLSQLQQAPEAAEASPLAREKARTSSIDSWVKKNTWQELSFSEQLWLCNQMSSADLIDKNAFSARWTGTLRVPASGTYQFSNFQGPGAEGIMKLWLNNQLVLDSSPKSAIIEENTLDADVNEKQPGILLTAGEAIEFRLDYIREPVERIPGIFRLAGYPAAVLFWESEVVEKQVVPKIAFTLPGVFDRTEQQGLRGEYFADTALTNSIVTRLDSAIDFLWDAGPIHTEYRETQREILTANLSKIAAPGFLAALASEDAQTFIEDQLPAILPLLTASERVAAVQVLLEQPELLKSLTFPQMTGALRWLSLLPESQVSIDLLVRWSEVLPTPVMQPAFFPGRGEGGYMSTNIEPYFRLSLQFLDGNVEEKLTELASHATREDGSCNVTLLYVLCCVSRSIDRRDVVLELLDEPVHNENLPPDIRATWFIAEAFAVESLFDFDFRPGNGLGPLSEALELDCSPEILFWVVQEMAARYIAMDKTEEAKSLILSVRDQFSDPAQSEVLDQILQKGDEVTAINVQIRETRDTHPETAELYVQELARRARVMEARGETETLNRFQASITEFEQQKTQKQTATETRSNQ